VKRREDANDVDCVARAARTALLHLEVLLHAHRRGVDDRRRAAGKKTPKRGEKQIRGSNNRSNVTVIVIVDGRLTNVAPRKPGKTN
jgi:hypothetical protein